jgi:putative ABC transport system ATP-binding protein
MLKLIGVHKTITNNKNTFSILKDINVEINKNSFMVIFGKSGSGKTTLLSLMSGLDTASWWEILFQDVDLVKSDKKTLTQYRKINGIIFQNYNLISGFSVLENIMMGVLSKGQKVDTSYLDTLITDLWLDKVKHDNVQTLSGGEKQRVAIARSLICKPTILFCDEPTGALDDENGQNVIHILEKLHQQGQTIVLVTHNAEFKQLATQIITLQDGQILSHITN